MSADAWYLDSSAIVKLVVVEPESAALSRWLEGRSPLVTCDLAQVEVVRAVRAADPAAVRQARAALAMLTLVRLNDGLYRTAAGLEATQMRSLDAIHLAAARRLGTDLAGVITYDSRMADAAARLGLHVEQPGTTGG